MAEPVQPCFDTGREKGDPAEDRPGKPGVAAVHRRQHKFRRNGILQRRRLCDRQHYECSIIDESNGPHHRPRLEKLRQRHHEGETSRMSNNVTSWW